MRHSTNDREKLRFLSKGSRKKREKTANFVKDSLEKSEFRLRAAEKGFEESG